MKQFESLYDALLYVSYCPICQCDLRINERDVKASSRFNSTGIYYYKLIFDFNDEEIVSIDVDSEEVAFHHNPQSKLHAHGTFYSKVSIECEDCCQYSFTLQLKFDIQSQKLEAVYLNSEIICLEDKDGQTNQIKNIYATDKTEYSLFCSATDGEDKFIVLPLIPLDINNPEIALKRIKSLIVFS